MTRPETLGKYQITGVLGTGAMGVVYTGFDPGIRRSVAIKTIHRKLVDDPLQAESMAARFLNEAQAVGRLMHPGIVAIYEYGDDGATSFIAMELVQGRSLAKVMATHELPEADVLKLVDQLLDALGFAHRHGVLHRDIKPANLILTAEGVLKVTDFGIARIENNAVTQAHLVIGTPGYMAPEQYMGDAIDERVDVFAAGALLYRMLTGQMPFAGTYEQVMYKILNEDPMPPSRLRGGEAHAKYDAIIARALAKDRDQRYHTASELRVALSSIARSIGLDGSDTTVVLRHDAAIAAAWRSGREPGSQAGSNLGAAHPGVGGSSALIQPGSNIGSGVGSSVVSGAGSGSGSGFGAGTHLTPIPGWDPALLAKIQRILASHIGPLAHLLVRQSAKKTIDFGTLAGMLAQLVDTAAGRTTFLDKVQALMPSGSIGRPAPHADGRMPTNPPSRPPARLTDATTDYALKTLTRHVGPIAKVMVRQAASQATSAEHFFQLLADQAGATARS